MVINENVPVVFDQLQNAVAMAEGSAMDGLPAYVSRRTGRIFVDCSMHGEANELPDDVEDEALYVAVPGRRDLDLGTRLARDFAYRYMGEAAEEVVTIFSRRGAWSRFKDLLQRRGLRDAWHAFADAAEVEALRDWAEQNGFELVGAPASRPFTVIGED